MQKLIIGTNCEVFSENVNTYLSQGWTVVPNSLCMTSISNIEDGDNNYEMRYAIVIELKTT
jgi:hypothetical protein